MASLLFVLLRVFCFVLLRVFLRTVHFGYVYFGCFSLFWVCLISWVLFSVLVIDFGFEVRFLASPLFWWKTGSRIFRKEIKER